MANIQVLAKRMGRSHDLAAALWDTGWYEARMLTSFIDEPDRVTASSEPRSRSWRVLPCTTRRPRTEQFKRCLPLIERAASDDRNFVKKGVSWALRVVGRRNLALNAAAVTLARRLSKSSEAAARWVGKEALRELEGPVVKRKLAPKK